MQQIIQTKRLKLVPLSLEKTEDLARFFEIYSNEKAMRFMPTPAHTTVEQTIASMVTDMSRQGAYHWAICTIDSDKAIDSDKVIGLVNFLGETRFPGMGYIVHPDHWGQGYAPEACQAILEFGFKELGYDRVELWINEFNAASIRVAQKLGFGLKGSIQQKYSHNSTYHTMLIYGSLASAWLGDTSSKQEDTELFNQEPVLMTHDVKATANYYKEKLGFNIDFIFGDPADHASVSKAKWTGRGVTIQLTSVPKERELKPSGYLYIFTNNVDELYKQYKASGVEILSEPQDQPWGMREFTIKDCDGHVLVFSRHL